MRHSSFFMMLIASAIVVVGLGSAVSVMDVDAAQYASISREMSVTGSVLKIYNGGREYLDKPPLLFWLSSALFWLTSVSTMTYKIPSIMFALWAGWGINRLGKSWFSVRAGNIAALMWLTCQGYFLMCLDVRTDLLLTSCVVLAVWQFDRMLTVSSAKSSLAAGFFTGLAMLAKGPLGFILPGILTFINLAQRKKWIILLQGKSWLWLPILMLVLIPMSIGLYQQFGDEGLYFFYWKQSFGRITGENEWRNDAGPFFLTQNLLWSSLPWLFSFLAALIGFVLDWRKFKVEFIKSRQFLLVLGVLIPLVALSRSHYQLPHYIFVVLPFVCLFTSSYLDTFLKSAEGSALGNISLGFSVLVVVAAIFIEFWVLSSNRWEFRVVWISWLLVVLTYIVAQKLYLQEMVKIVLIPAVAGIWVNGMLNASFYPALLEFQPSRKLANWFESEKISNPNLFVYKHGASHSLDFYTARTNLVLYEPKDLQFIKPAYLIGNAEGYRELVLAGKKVEVLRVYPEYSVQFLSISFLNPRTRSQQVRQIILLKVLD